MSDLYQAVTDRIVATLERGAPPWVRPWASLPDAVPINAGTRKPYRGVNFTLLSLEAVACGYASNQWLTYRQALEQRAQVRRGEHGTPIVFWQRRATQTEDPEDEPSERRRPFLRAYTVFNVAQIDGLPEPVSSVRPVGWTATEQAEALLHASGATIRHGGVEAYYCPTTDAIQLPTKAAFPAAAGYYGTALHELTHWTGHTARCHRQLRNRFGEAAYAAEELIAELGAAFLCAHCGIDGELRHAGYLASWLVVLRQDKRAIFTAAAQAQRAADYVLRLAEFVGTDALAA